MNDFRNELLELIQSNPELPIMVFADTDNAYDGGYTGYTNLRVYIEEITLYNDEEWLEYDDVEDRVRDILCDKLEYKHLSDSQFDRAVEEYINKNYTFEKYICIYAN